jgi:glycosyltransferase involved in cell wall biosynthesis
MKILVTIPVYNEAHQLAKQLDILNSFLEENDEIKTLFDFEVVDNNSKDETLLILKKASMRYDWLKFQHINIKGVGAALQQSWIATGYTHFGYMDLDFATPLSTLRQIPTYLGFNTMVVGSRFLPESLVIGRNWRRRIASWGLNRFARIFFANELTDLMCGFKFINSKIYSDIFKYLTKNSGWFHCAEILITVNHLNMAVKEVPVVWTDSTHSNVKIFSLSVEYFLDMIDVKKNLKCISLDKT